MPLPELTHLQFLIVVLLADGQTSGRQLRERLAEHDVQKSGPAFYQLMVRMEDSDYVKGWYNEKVIDGQRVKERFYEVTGGGMRALQASIAFYKARAGRKLAGGLANG